MQTQSTIPRQQNWRVDTTLFLTAGYDRDGLGPPVQRILNLDYQSNPSRAVENLNSSLFQLPLLTVRCLMAVQWLLHSEGSLEDVSSKTGAVKRRAVGDSSITY